MSETKSIPKPEEVAESVLPAVETPRFDILGQCIKECIGSIIDAQREALLEEKINPEIGDTDIGDILRECRQICYEWLKRKTF